MTVPKPTLFPPETVLVVERGYFDNKPEAIVPFYASGVDESVMMRPKSAPVANLNNSTYDVAVPAVVGGGSGKKIQWNLESGLKGFKL